jgi:hypothetical protein
VATRLKTVEFAHPPLAALVDNTLTTLTQITVYLPETGTRTFRSVVAEVSAQATGTAAGNITSRQIQCRLGAAGYTTNTNANLYTGSGEDLMVHHAVDLTSHFTTNWSGTSMTFDTQVLIDSTMTTPAFTNVCVTLYVTYEYDDTSTTQVKTVRIPLNAPVGALATTKPGTATATIPALDTELPEASKTYRSQHIVVQGTTGVASTTDSTITMQLDSTASHTSGISEAAQNGSHFFRYVWDCSAVLDESISMGFYIWGSVARYNHVQAYLVVTYEFDASAANDVFVSLMIPSDTGLGGQNASTAANRLFGYLSIPESGLVTKQLAYFGYWDTTGVTAGFNMRLGTGSYVAYTDLAATVAGCSAAMVRNDSAFTLVQGDNVVTLDVYCTETATDFLTALNGFFLVNYTCDKPTDGHGAVNHTVRWGMEAPYSGASVNIETTAAWAPVIPEADYRLVSMGVEFDYYANSTNGGFGCFVDVERTSGEDQLTWDVVAGAAGISDFETGLRRNFVSCLRHFQRFPGDEGFHFNSLRRDVETTRRWRAYNGSLTAIWDRLALLFTYHSQTWDVTGTVTGSAGGTVTIDLHNAITGEKLKETTRSGNGSYTLTWYDDTTSLYTVAREDGTHLARSDDGVAA